MGRSGENWNYPKTRDKRLLKINVSCSGYQFVINSGNHYMTNIMEKEICYWCGNTGKTAQIVEDEISWVACEEHEYRGRELSLEAEEAIKRYGKINRE